MSLSSQEDGTIYGTTRYGESLYGRPLDAAGAVLPVFSAQPLNGVALSYTLVSLTWSIPIQGVNLRLVRNSFSTPADETDGFILPIPAPVNSIPSYVDQTLSTDMGGTFLYYSLFNQDKTGYWWRAADEQTILPKDWGYSSRLWSAVPAYYHQLDRSQQQGVLRP